MTILVFPTILMAAVQVPAQFDLPFSATTVAEARQWQEQVRTRLLEIVTVQNKRTDLPLDVQRGEFKKCRGYEKATVSFQGNEGQRLEATLTVPNGAGPFPGVLCLHGHSGSREKVHDPKTEYHGFAAELAKRGFVTVAPSLAHCEFAPNQLWNLMRGLDVLVAQPNVDAARVGVAGLSMGGEWTMWLAACDPRVKAAVVSGWMCTTEGVLRVPNCPCWMPPGLLTLCDIAEVEILIAPRPLLFESAIEDGCFPVDATRAGFEKIKRGYGVFAAEANVHHHVFPGKHEWNGGQAYAFLVKSLGK